MDFSTAVKTCFSKFIDFTGRAQRSEFWYFFLFTFLLRLVVSIVVGSGFALGLLNLALFIPILAVGARRLHDTGRTGWWQLLWLLPVLGWIILLIFMVKRGDEGENHHGFDPLDGAFDQYEPAQHDRDTNRASKPTRNRSRRDAEGRDIDGDDTSNEDNPWVKIRRQKAEAAKAEDAADNNQAEETQKKITEEKKRRIEPPKFGRDAAKKD